MQIYLILSFFLASLAGCNVKSLHLDPKVERDIENVAEDVANEATGVDVQIDRPHTEEKK